MYINNSIKQYIDDLAAKKPAPGGGSVAALAGAAGAALISMVCAFTLGKKKYREFEPDIQNILSRAESLRKDLLESVDEDIEAYKKFASSSKDESSLKEALGVPLKVCELTYEALKICPELAEKGNALLVSDVGCAAELLEGAFFSSLFNVEINLQGIKDESFVAGMSKAIEPMKEEAAVIKNTVVEIVTRKMRVP